MRDQKNTALNQRRWIRDKETYALEVVPFGNLIAGGFGLRSKMPYVHGNGLYGASRYHLLLWGTEQECESCILYLIKKRNQRPT